MFIINIKGKKTLKHLSGLNSKMYFSKPAMQESQKL